MNNYSHQQQPQGPPGPSPYRFVICMQHKIIEIQVIDKMIIIIDSNRVLLADLLHLLLISTHNSVAIHKVNIPITLHSLVMYKDNMLPQEVNHQVIQLPVDHHHHHHNSKPVMDNQQQGHLLHMVAISSQVGGVNSFERV